MNKHSRGVTLIELLIGALIGGIIVAGAISLFRVVTKSSSTSADNAKKDVNAEQVTQNLKILLEGTRGFQGLSFSPDGTKRSFSAGVYIEPDVDVSGTASSDNDRIFFMTRVPMSAELRLAGAVGPGPATQLPVRSANGTTAVDSVLANNDLVVISNGETSDVLKIIGAPTPTGAAVTAYPLTDPSFSNSFKAAGGSPFALTRNYLADDLLMKARILTIGLDPIQKTLQVTGEPVSPRVIATEVTQFSCSYLVRAGATCAGTVIPVAFSRAQWALLNTGQQNLCYQFISQLRFDFVQNGVAGQLTINTIQ